MEKEMAPHSSILAWSIPWTEEPGGYSPRGRKNWTRLSDFTYSLTTNKIQICNIFLWLISYSKLVLTECFHWFLQNSCVYYLQ